MNFRSIFGEANSNKRFILYLLLVVLAGYGFFVPDLALLDDDIAGRYKAIQNKNAIDTQLDNFRQWTMGRPIGHASNVSFQGFFLLFPESVIIFFAILAVGAQALFFRNILEKSSFDPFLAQIVAIVFFVTPIATSLYLPVHSLATELSTWSMLISIWLMLLNRPVFSGLFSSLQFLIYESYATIFWLPLVFLFIKLLLTKDFIWRSYLKSSVKFFVSFSVFTIIILVIRENMPGVGRDSQIEDMGIQEIAFGMIEAGWIGISSALAFQIESIKWSLVNGPKYILALYFLFPLCVFLSIHHFHPVSKSAYSRSLSSSILIGVLGLLLMYFSYMIYFEQRYPPEITVSRLANIHSAGRFGLALIFGATMILLSKHKRIQGIFASISIGSFLAFQHAYGYQEALSSHKKNILIEAIELACRNSNEGDILAIVAPVQLSVYKTDIVLGWTTPYIAPTSFIALKNKVVVIPHNYAEEFMTIFKSENGKLNFLQVKPYVHHSFKSYKWLLPWGDMDSWNLDDHPVKVSQIVHHEEGVYTQKMLTHDTNDESSVCILR